MPARAKARWVAFVATVLVAIAWGMLDPYDDAASSAGLAIVTFLIGAPIALALGTRIGDFADRCGGDRRWRIHLMSVGWMLIAAIPPAAIVSKGALVMLGSALAIAILGSLALERWTRVAELAVEQPGARANGRWLGAATVAAVTIAWSLLDGQGHRSDLPAMFVSCGVCVGMPVGLVGGTYIGALAGRCRDRRWTIHVATTAWTLVVALVPIALCVFLQDHSWPEPAAMIVTALAAALPASVVLERWTRPIEPLATARIEAA